MGRGAELDALAGAFCEAVGGTPQPSTSAAGLLATVTVPALVLTGEQSPPFLRAAAQAAAAALAGGRLAVLRGQSHHIDPEATARAVAEFLTG